MPVNAGPEYYLAEKKFQQAKTKEEKIAALEEMIRALPKHKGAHNILAQLKKRLSDLKKEAAKKSSTKRSQISIRKEGYAQICIVGFTNSGKSTLLKALTGRDVRIADHPFTTKIPQIGMMQHNDVPLQVVEIPSNFNSENISIIRNADEILITLDGSRNVQEQKTELEKILNDNRISLKKMIWLTTKQDELDTEKIKNQIWKNLNLIRIYTKSPGKPKQFPAIALRPGSTVKDVAEKIHKDFLKTFRFARIFNGTKFSGQQVGMEYKVKDGDVVEIHTK